MTKLQITIIEKIESLIMQLAFSDRKDNAKGEIESLKTALREVENALN